jgi:hypothetical protein
MRTQMLVAAMLCLFSVGCIAPSYKSLNIQRSAIRGAADASVTVSLDCTDTADQAVAIAKTTAQITAAVDKFLSDGKVGDLTIPEITGKLRELIPPDYQFIFDMLIAQVSGQTVPVGKIGANNIKRLQAVCSGILEGCASYKAEDRPVPAPTARDFNRAPSGIATMKQFGEKIRAEMAKRAPKVQ